MKRLFQKNMVGALSLVLGLLVLPSFAQATGIGESLFVQDTGNVSVTFAGSNAGYTSTLYYGETALFSNRAAVGSTVSLGNFAAGDQLNFRLEVQNTGNTFFTGLGANNADGVAHASVENLGEGSSQIGFEDLYGGGDRDYNDLVFDFTNTSAGGSQTNGGNIANPEPSTIILFGSGLLGLGAWRLRKKKA